MIRFSKRSVVAVGVVAVAAVMEVAGLALSPAQAQQAANVISRVFAVINCTSINACDGGSNSGKGFGVLATSAKNNGVDASTKNPSTTTHYGKSAVYGHDDSTDSGTLNVGVAGFSPDGTGVEANSTNGLGLGAVSTNGYAISADSVNASGIIGVGANTGVYGEADIDAMEAYDPGSGNGLYAVSIGGAALVGVQGTNNATPTLALFPGMSTSAGLAMEAVDPNSAQIFSLDDAGDVQISGLLYTAGTCSTGCSKTRHVDEYAPRESAPTMEDIGEGQLVAGKAYVRFDPAYANVIDRGATYVVFVSPEGPNQGLYVTQKTAQGFEVMENPGGHSSIPFGYRIVAKPYGVTAARLPMSVQPQMPTRVRLHSGAAALPHSMQ